MTPYLNNKKLKLRQYQLLKLPLLLLKILLSKRRKKGLGKMLLNRSELGVYS